MADSSNVVPSSKGHSPEPQVIKAIIERDYSDVKHVRFFEACPVRILPLVAADVVKNTVRQINEIIEDLTKYGGAQEIFENTVSAMSLYLANPLLPHGSKACLDRLTAFIETENEKIYKPLGIVLINPVNQALLQLEFQAAVFEKGQLPSWKDINLTELLKFVWSKDGLALPKRDAVEVLIEMSSRLKEPIPVPASKAISIEIEVNNFGVADFEFRSLLIQFLFNVRKTPPISGSLFKSSIFSAITKMTPASIEEDTRCMIDRAKDILSLPLVELHYAMKIYSRPSSKTANIMTDFNCESIGMNVVEPVSEEPILIEILYSSIESWSVQNENTVGDAFYLEMKLKNSARCKLCFDSLANLALAKFKLLGKAPSAPNRKVSVVAQPSQNTKEIEPTKATEDTIDSPCSPSSPPPLSEDDSFEDPKPSKKQERLLKKAIALIETPAPPKTKIKAPVTKITNTIMTPPLTEIPKKLQQPVNYRVERLEVNATVCPLERLLDAEIESLKMSMETAKNRFQHKIKKKMKKHGKHLRFHLKKKQIHELLRTRKPTLSIADLTEVRQFQMTSFAGIRKALCFKLGRKEIIDAVLHK